MKIIPTFLILLLAGTAAAQHGFPDFLQGTWKMENREIYERWDRLNENAMKGFTYELKNKQMAISEYLDISGSENEITYTATVPGQNQGNGIRFKLIRSDSLYIFENPVHDFPKKIVYKKLSDTEIFVQVSDGAQKGFSYKMKKQFEKTSSSDTSVSNPDYDASLAQKLGADDYGMKGYILVILKTGKNQTTDKDFINNSFRGHMENINRLVEQGKLVIAGPFGKNDSNFRGIFILNAANIEEAEKLLQTDPAIKEGLLAADLYNWYGSAALPEYLESSDKIWKVMP
jgi:uncharacterized protein YciI